MDVLKLRDWYRTPMGHMVRRIVQSYLNDFWPELAGKRVLVVGYGVPYVHLWGKETDVFLAMTGKMGVMHWPESGKNRSLLTWSSELPFASESFDRVLLVHALEFADDELKTLAECTRVLKNDGRLMTVVPNRNGAWSRREVSPFARGKPFSASQLQRSFTKNNLLMTQSTFGLFVPPTPYQWIQRRSSAFEKAGNRWWAPFGGIVVAEGKKDLFSGTVVRVEKPRTRRMVQPRLTPAG